MKVLLALVLALNFNPIAPIGLYQVTSIISTSNDGDIDVQSEDLIRTDIKITPDQILVMEAVGEYNKLVVTTTHEHGNVVDFKMGNNEEGEPFVLSIIDPDTKCVTTYILYDLENHYE